MSAKSADERDVARLLQAHAPDVRALVQQLRALIIGTVPTANESANPGWHSINYRHPEHGYFCGLFPQAEGVNLLFEYGVLLPDPHQLLQGEGKQVRFITLAAGSELPAEALQDYVRSALDLPPKKSEKMALIRAGARWQDSNH